MVVMMTDNRSPPADVRRVRAVLALRSSSASDLAGWLGCTPSHLRLVLLGLRDVSRSLWTKLERALLKDEWRFVRGATDVLRDHGPGRGFGARSNELATRGTP